jgi:hypothetical protein
LFVLGHRNLQSLKLSRLQIPKQPKPILRGLIARLFPSFTPSLGGVKINKTLPRPLKKRFAQPDVNAFMFHLF